MNATFSALDQGDIISFARDNKTALLVGSALALFVLFTRKSSKGPLPPGPKPLPIIGNAHQLPKEDDYLVYTEWGKQYGNVVHVSALGQSVILLNSIKATTDLLEKKSSIYSDRPYFRMAADIVGWKRTLALSSYSSDRFRKYRKLMHNALNVRVAENYFPLQERSVHYMLQSLLDTPSDFRHHLRHNAGAVIAYIAYAYEIDPKKDYFVDLAESAADNFSRSCTPGQFLIDLIPWLQYVPKWFPGAGWKRTAEEWRKVNDDLHHIPYQMVKDQVHAGTAKPSFVATLLDGHESKDLDPEEEDIFKWTAGALYSGGADTTVSAASTFVLAMLLHPEVQKKAQAEIDKHMGLPSSVNRLPGFNDRAALPYVEALVKESLRWHPVAKLGLPHRLMEDDVYEGYHLPAGATVIGNIWAVGHDETLYPEPNKFIPERHLDKGDGSPLPPDPKTYAFGFGRRVCPGLALGWNSLFIAAASTLACFDIVPVIGEDGKPILPDLKYEVGIISHPYPFQCQFRPRSPHIVDLIRQTVAHDKEIR